MSDTARQDYRARRLRILKKTVSDSTFSGLSHIAAAHSRLVSVFWTIVFIAGIIGFGFNFYDLTARFLKCPITENYGRNTEPFVWPDITFCNPTNPIPFWLFEDSENIWKSLINKTKAYSLALYEKGNLVKKTNQIAMSTLSPHEFGYDKYTSKFILDADKNNDKNEMAFLNNNDDGLNFPFEEDYKGYYYTRFDSNLYPTPCLTFNPAGFGNHSQRMTSSKNFESIKLYILMDMKSYKLFDAYRESPRLRIYISSPGHTISKQKVRVSTGNDVYMKLSTHNFKRLKDRGTCIDKPFEIEEFDVNFAATRKYFGDFSDCRQAVLQEHTVSVCGCYNPAQTIVKLPRVIMPRLCYNMSLYTPSEMADKMLCLKRVLGDKLVKEDVEKRCARFRQDVCHETYYHVTQSILPWPSEMSPSREEFMKVLESTLYAETRGSLGQASPKDYLRKNLVYLKFEVESAVTQLVEEEYSYTGAQYISDIGGIIGLWLGLSIISAFELVQIIYAVCRFLS